MWWMFSVVGFAAPPSASGPDWIEGRWWVASETVEVNAPLVIQHQQREFVTPAWQIEAVVDCRADTERPSAAWCRVEDVALRLATYDHWQRPADRLRIDRTLQQVQAQLRSTPVLVEFPAPGWVVLADPQIGPAELSATLLGDAFSGFHLPAPPDGWRLGAQWQTQNEPLLDLHLRKATLYPDPAVHELVSKNATWAVRTASRIKKHVLTPPRTRFEHRRTTWRGAKTVGKSITAVFDVPRLPRIGDGKRARPTYMGWLDLQAEATLDAHTQLLAERRWTVLGTGSIRQIRSGQLRRLADGESVELGSTEQVSLPNTDRSHVPPWAFLIPEVTP
ncbi:MAG: hypothetical protein AAGA48_03405 [Myxococcota bacterium]